MMISMAALLKRQSPLPAYGHGWIMNKDGKRWNPALKQQGFSSNKKTGKRGKSWLLKLKQHLPK